MITEALLTVAFSISSGFFALFPQLSWNPDEGLFSTFLDFVTAAVYFLPLDTISAIIGIVIGFNIVKIIISFLRMIWDVLPLV